MKNWLFSFSGSRLISRLWLLVILGCFALLLNKAFIQDDVAIETNILALLPENRQDPAAQYAFDKMAESVSNKVIFVLSGKDKTSLYASAEHFSSQLSQLSIFKSVTARISEQTQQEWAAFYYDNRFQLLSPEQKERLTFTPEMQTQYVLQSVYSPFSGVTGAELSGDPFLLFRDYISHLSGLSGKFKTDDGYLTQDIGETRYLLIIAELKPSPYSFLAQQKVPELTALEQKLSDEYQINIVHTGALFYAAFGTESAKSEISTIGLGSLLGVILLFLAIYRSTLPLALALVSIFCGFIVALSVSLLIFEKIHIFSLVFGSSLIGVSIDYSFHYLTERLAAGKVWQADKALKQILGAITLGLITSLIGYLGLLVAPFPGLQQLSVFSALGLLASYLTVVCWYPILAKKPSGERNLPGNKLWEHWLSWWRLPAFRWGLPVLFTFVSLILAGNITYNDDIRQLQAIPKALKQQERTIQELTGLSSSQQMLLVSGQNEQDLLQELEQLSGQLDEMTEKGELGSYQSVHQYLPSISVQEDNYTSIKKLYREQAVALESALGLSVSEEQIPSFAPVTVSDFLASPVSDAVDFLWLGKINGMNYTLVSLNKVSDKEEIKAWAESRKGATYLNKADEISLLFGEYRWNVTQLLLIAVILIWLILSWRYSVKQGILMVLPPIIAGFAAIAITGATGLSVNLFNLLALILILGIGIDYTLFFTEQKQSKSTVLAITLSALTTILSFGLLALSHTHAIHSFGITILTGIFVSWLLSPLALNSKEKV